MTNNLFSRELELFQRHRDEWVHAHPGKFVVIQDSVVADGFFATYGEAFQAGLRIFGVGRGFLIKQVWVTEPVYFVS